MTKPSFQIVDLTQDAGRLAELLKNQRGEVEPAAKRLELALLSAACKTVVCETRYKDIDFRAGYTRFYYLHHRETPINCERLHFFSSVVNERDLELMEDNKKQTYLGFTVMRPLPAHPTGRSVLSGKVAKAMFPDLHRGEERFVTCSARYDVNLAGNNIHIPDGVPWIQQDKLVGVCASAAMWVANTHMCHQFPADFRHYSTTQITDFAVAYSMNTGRAMPSEGLHGEQMVRALKAMGYEPLLIGIQNIDEARRCAYQYVESSVPVIALVMFPSLDDKSKAGEGHAITLVGHTLSAKTQRKARTTPLHGRDVEIGDASDYVPRFIVQDDSSGPFRFLDLLTFEQAQNELDPKLSPLLSAEEAKKAAEQFPCVVRLGHGELKESIAFLYGFIVPLPLRVTLKNDQAQKTAIELVKEWVSPKLLDSKQLVFRTFLQPSNRLKRWWSPARSNPKEIAIEIRSHPMPNWVWITEFADPKHLGSSRKVLGQVVQDSAGRGTQVLWDDIIAFITPDDVRLSRPDVPGYDRSMRRPDSEAISQYRVMDIP